ncbi:D-allose-binding periplasmic protein precursor [Pirellulimonas nuda]|uniref:D-allose-binding periplasmic protein n=1 Tax=Pirellulimonas nuda TaxID=2528009 RepID=A0A518D5G9_9BACT|nr:substrate-binding domain-containing protein [Pirellulimonas nuda]QDU86714.1 D-allose-binding periplasmic protein precursor [Pirellulimonas nuda]
MSAQRSVMWLVIMALCVGLGYLGRSYLQPSEEKSVEARPRLQLVVGGPDPFWQIVIAGARDAASRYDADLEVSVPEGGASSQTAILGRIDTKAVDGVAVSSMAPAEQTRMLSRLASEVKLVTYDNDSPQSLRHCYIGTSNYAAGKLSAELVREALPDGGEVAIFLGDVDRENARQRRAAFMYALLNATDRDPEDDETPEEPAEGNGYTIVKTYFDESDPDKCKANLQQALKDHPDLKCIVGLYGYVGPLAADAVKEAKRGGDVKVVAFDEHEGTLRGVESGEIHGTVVQNPYQYGYEAIRLLASLTRKIDEAVPLAGAGTMFLPCATLHQDDVAAYREKLNERLKGADKGA